jgi:hypothetical protein
MKEIYLTGKRGRGEIALVDDDDYEHLNQFKWYVSNRGRYALRTIKVNGKTKNLLMHRVIMKLNFGDKRQIDHIDHHGLNNQKSNLRICSSQENNRNVRVDHAQTLNSTSLYKGVSWDKARSLWRSTINLNGKQITLGRFSCEHLAAKAYNIAAIKHHGEFACLNIIVGENA